jgi:hypothetical protein
MWHWKQKAPISVTYRVKTVSLIMRWAMAAFGNRSGLKRAEAFWLRGNVLTQSTAQ